MDSGDNRARSLPETEAMVEPLYASLATLLSDVFAGSAFKEFASNACEFTCDMTGLVL